MDCSSYENDIEENFNAAKENFITAEDENINAIEVGRTQFQQGKVDCGLYAIAFATEFCFGNNPECYRYHITTYVTVDQCINLIIQI